MQPLTKSAVRPVLRRAFLQGITASGAVFAAGPLVFAGELNATTGALSVAQAHTLASDGKVTLIDIRRPDEWYTTGVGEGAHRLDMRSKDFLVELDKLVDGDYTKPVAIICATGVRSKWLSRQLTKTGFSQIFDVPEGMMGSRAGPGWIRAGLPVVK